MEYSVSLFFTLSVLALILWMLGVWSLRIYNNLVFTQNNAFKAFANIDVLLVQRSDEVPNLETIVNELSEHEKTLLAELVELRAQVAKRVGCSERVLAHNSMSAQFSELFARLESYPRLVSNDLFRKFYDRITELENKISLQREFFNDAVTLHNDIRAKFPNILFAKLFGFPYQAVLTKSYIRDNID